MWSVGLVYLQMLTGDKSPPKPTRGPAGSVEMPVEFPQPMASIIAKMLLLNQLERMSVQELVALVVTDEERRRKYRPDMAGT